MDGEAMMVSFSTDMIITEYFTQRMNLHEAKVMWTELKLSGASQREGWVSLMAYHMTHFICIWKNVNSDTITEIMMMQNESFLTIC